MIKECILQAEAESMAIRVKAKEFVKDMESAMDDSSLMAKYGLTSVQLQRVFKQLVDMGLMSEGRLRLRAELTDTQITRAFVDAQEDEVEIP
jgi:hypothetical protein